jgi:hypothetical protein
VSRPTFREWFWRPGKLPARPWFAGVVAMAALGRVLSAPTWLVVVTSNVMAPIVSYLWDTRNE